MESRLRFLQWLFTSRYTKSLEAECERLRIDNALLRELQAQVTSNLLQGAGMAGLELNKPKETPQPKARLVPSVWRRKMEAKDRESEDSFINPDRSKEKN